ncbi:tyrosine-type recombinase/integrase [Effusibacillus pohliae]|uniref:tyrosine-type recombinase/integrase n=1 Tax=Effusibacillus pohliae TaxID=232270 RepID=UPI00036D5DF5|nr:tyrosine-type recombinase/integrase [Effusibacillus pohliae]
MPIPVPQHIASANRLLDQLLAQLGPEGLAVELHRRGLMSSMGQKSVEPCSMERALFEFEEQVRLTSSMETRKTYLNEIEQFQRFVENKGMLGRDVDEVLIEHFIGDYLSMEHYAPATRNKKISVLRKFWKEALRQNWINKEIPDLLKTERVDQKIPKALSETAVTEILEWARQTKYGVKYFVLISTTLGTGCRIGEVVNIRIRDIDWEGRKAIVFGKYHREGRPVWLGKELTSLLREYVTFLYGEDAIHSPQKQNLFLFSATGGMEPLCKNSVGETFKRIVTKMRTISEDEKAHISFHCLRHTYATNGMLTGVDLYTLSKLLGHRHVSTTEIYLSVGDYHLQQAAEKAQGNLKLHWG